MHGVNYTDYVNLLENIRLQEPDIIVITGDLIDRNTNNFSGAYNFVEELIRINPSIYFVSGNHEWENDNTKEFLQGLLKRNVVTLNNKNIPFDFMGTTINLCGVDDFHTNHANLEAATKYINRDFYTILLSHSPGIVTEKYLTADLVLSGHTHGGQVRLPLIGGIVAPGQGFFPKLQRGTYNLGNGKYLYIDSGLGTSTMPIRFLNRGQVSLITIRGKGI